MFKPRIRSVRRAGAFAMAAMLLACDDESAVPPPSLDGSPPQAPDAGARCATSVADSLIEHACFHALMGPHAERDAGTVESPVDLDRPHTAFHVRLSPRPDGTYGGALSYRARVAGEYAFFTRGAALQLGPRGARLPARFGHATELCTQLPDVQVYALEAGSYLVELEGAQSEVAVVIESLNEGAVEDAYRFECADRTRVE